MWRMEETMIRFVVGVSHHYIHTFHDDTDNERDTH